jgi:aspartate/methionine/tyrosine aminotransferase
VRSAWTAKTRGLMVATPSNPVGTSVPPSELAAICDCARQHGAWRIIDEIYLNLSYGKSDRRPRQSVLSIDSNAAAYAAQACYEIAGRFGILIWP